MSIGFLIDEETPMIWRGPMVTQALEQLLKDTNWQDVDYRLSTCRRVPATLNSRSRRRCR